MKDLLLDPDIKNCVLLPLLAITVMVTVVRTFIMQLLQSPKKVDVKEVKLRNVLGRSTRLRSAGGFIHWRSFEMRRRALLGDADSPGPLAKKPKGAAARPPNPMTNPSGMLDGLKGNMTYMVTHIGMITWISMMFSGFLLVKVPFPLTARFKDMLQRGIELSDLDSSYVSSLSWYFIVTFGLRGFLGLIMPDARVGGEERMMQMQMGMGGGGPQGFDAGKAFNQEKENLDIAAHKSLLSDIEQDLAARKF